MMLWRFVVVVVGFVVGIAIQIFAEFALVCSDGGVLMVGFAIHIF